MTTEAHIEISKRLETMPATRSADWGQPFVALSLDRRAAILGGLREEMHPGSTCPPSCDRDDCDEQHVGPTRYTSSSANPERTDRTGEPERVGVGLRHNWETRTRRGGACCQLVHTRRGTRSCAAHLRQ